MHAETERCNMNVFRRVNVIQCALNRKSKLFPSRYFIIVMARRLLRRPLLWDMSPICALEKRAQEKRICPIVSLELKCATSKCKFPAAAANNKSWHINDGLLRYCRFKLLGIFGERSIARAIIIFFGNF